MISIAIKALNEEAKIARCIESAIAALREVPNPSEIILADSVSTDGTIEIARRYPITVVQFQDAEERGCGAAVQLGFQHSRGDYIMLLDGDMQLLPGFLPKALAKLEREPRLAGVAGLVQDTTITNLFDRRRVATGSISRAAPSVSHLGGGGLYKREAIDDAGGYAADRNLKAWEEAELGMRLTAAGWSLERIECLSTLHTGHAADGFTLLKSQWRSRRLMANGVLLKQSMFEPWMFKAFRLLLHPILVILMWIGAMAIFAVSLTTRNWSWSVGYLLVVLGLVLLFAIHKRSLKQAIVSFGIWHLMAGALLLGLRESVVGPTDPIRSLKLSSPPGD